jgi:hypothetical protein
MIVAPWAEFGTDLPDDHEENEDQTEITLYGGRNVAEVIAEILRGLGCTVSEPIYADEHGWELDVEYRKRRLWAQVTQIEDYIFVLQDKTWLAKLMGGRNPDYLDILQRLAASMAQHPRLSDVRWYIPADVTSGKPGAPGPIIDG